MTLLENISRAAARLPKKVLFSGTDTSYSATGTLRLLLGINTDRVWMHIVHGVVLLRANIQPQTKHVLHDLYSFTTYNQGFIWSHIYKIQMQNLN